MKRERKLTDSEIALWHLITKNVKPLHAKSNFENAKNIPEEYLSIFDYKKEILTNPSPKIQKEKKKPSIVSSSFDLNTKRKIKKEGVQAKLDLHGLKQDSAYDQLHVFLKKCYERRYRYVLVITGKGNIITGSGVLRQNVPRWLQIPPFSTFVVGYNTAPREYGGEGALCLHIRSNMKRGD